MESRGIRSNHRVRVTLRFLSPCGLQVCILNHNYKDNFCQDLRFSFLLSLFLLYGIESTVMTSAP